MGWGLSRDVSWHAYPLGQVHNGGGALEAYMAAAVMSFAGLSAVALKAVPLALSMASLVLLYGWVVRFWGRRAAVLAAMIYAVAPTLLPWQFQLRGYAVAQVLFIVVLWCAYEFLYGRAGRRAAFILGAASGLLVWCTELSLPPLTVAAACLIWRQGGSLAHAIAGFLAGYAPALSFNAANGMANWSFLWNRKLASGAAFRPGGMNIPGMLTEELPRFFGPDTSYLYLPSWSHAGAIFYAFFIAAAALAVWRRRETELLLLGMVLAILAAYSALPWRSPGHLLWLCPLAAALGGSALSFLLSSRERPVRAAGAVVLAALIVVGAYEIVKFARRDDIEGLAVAADGRSLSLRRYRGEDFRAVLAYLSRRDIACVWAAPSFQLPLIFESREKILATVFMPFYVPDHSVMPAYDRAAGACLLARPAWVLETDSSLRRPAEAFLSARGKPWVEVPMGDLVVLAEAVQ